MVVLSMVVSGSYLVPGHMAKLDPALPIENSKAAGLSQP